MSEPTTHTAGDTLRFTRSLPDYPPQDGWALSYALVNAQGSIQFSAQDNGDGQYLVEVPASDTKSWAPGRYRMAAVLTRGGERVTLGLGEIEILPDLAAAVDGLDTRGRWARILDNLERAYERMSAGEVQSAEVSYGQRMVRFRDLGELVKAIRQARLQAELERAGNELSAAVGVRIHTRF